MSGVIAGTIFGIVLMCMLQINRIDGRENQNEN